MIDTIHPINNISSVNDLTVLEKEALEVVRETLRDFEDARNNRNFLVFKVLKNYGWDFNVTIEEARMMPCIQTILRHGRTVQNTMGLHRPFDEDIERARDEKEQRLRRYYGRVEEELIFLK